ncbi:MAG: anti-sigma regulatory factor [Gemmatimonadetes bacterium]|nr:anti-sigma regulatory factor [Gemmatimonadota bacterium]
MTPGSEGFTIRTDADVVAARQAVRARAVELRFSLVDQTKIVTAASELARNTLVYGGGGSMRLETVEKPPRTGLRMVFEDRGPGIPDVEQALRDGFTTGGGLGLGLGGSRRLLDEMEIESAAGEGTRITAIKWK